MRSAARAFGAERAGGPRAVRGRRGRDRARLARSAAGRRRRSTPRARRSKRMATGVNAAHARYLADAAPAADRTPRRGRARARRDSIPRPARPRRAPRTSWSSRASRCDACRRRRRAPRSTRAERAARHAGIPALIAEVDSRRARPGHTRRAADYASGEERPLLLARGRSVTGIEGARRRRVPLCRARRGRTVISLARRPVLFALARALAEAWPDDVPRDVLVARAFRAKRADESHRARLRVEMGRLRAVLGALADVTATKRGFALVPHGAREVVGAGAARRGTSMPPCSPFSPTASRGRARPWRWRSGEPAHRAAGARLAGGGRQGAVVRPRPRAALDDAARAGIRDDLVTPRSAADRLG